MHIIKNSIVIELTVHEAQSLLAALKVANRVEIKHLRDSAVIPHSGMTKDWKCMEDELFNLVASPEKFLFRKRS